MDIEEIARKVQEAERFGKKIAMFHYQVLINADELANVNPREFCRSIGVRESYVTEFSKMLSLAKMIRAQGKGIIDI